MPNGLLLIALALVPASFATFIWPIHLLPRTSEPTIRLPTITEAIPVRFPSVSEPTIQLQCPADGTPFMLSLDVYDVELIVDPQDPEGHDELRRRRRALEESPVLNIFERRNFTDPNWRYRRELYYCLSQLQQPVNQRTGQQYFYRTEYGGLTGRTVSTYVASVVLPEYLGTGEDTTRLSRSHTNSLVEASGLDGRSQQDRLQSFDAGHILGNQLGGPVEQWNLYPQNGQLNRHLWNRVETRIANEIRANRYYAIAEYYLEYGHYPTVPDFVHFSYRYFSPSGELVGSLNGMYPNHLPDAQRRYRLVNHDAWGSQIIFEESNVTSELDNEGIIAGRILASLGFIDWCRSRPPSSTP